MISSKISAEFLCQRTEEDQIDLLSQAFEGDWKLGRNPSVKQFIEKYSLSLSAANKVELERQLRSVLSECQSTFPRPRDSSSTIVGSTLSQERPPLFQFDLPYQFGEYELNELIGTGGKSVVYRGTCDQSDEPFAIKITPSAFITDQRSFERELNVVSQLDHPRIIKPLYSGTFREWSFVSSKYLAAPNLRDYLEANGPLTVAQAVAIVASLAETLQYAHDRGVIHRDLKPRNVLLIDNHNSQDSSIEPIEAFTPIVIDFGLAKDTNSESCATLTGTFFGTPAYTSPEQAKFDTRNTSNRSDIYSLGVILYELIGYSTPFQGSVESLLNQIAVSEAPPVRKRNRLIDTSLANIVHKCLRLDPNRRYATAGDIANDLRRWLSSRQVDTKAYSKSEQFKIGMRKLSRHRGLLIGAAIFLLAINVVVVSRINTKPKVRSLYDKSPEKVAQAIDVADGSQLELIVSQYHDIIDIANLESDALTEAASYVEPSADKIEDEKDSKALANKAVLLAEFQQPDLLWLKLKHSKDPRIQSYAIDALVKTSFVASALVERLLTERDYDVQFALLFTLANYSVDRLEAVHRDKLHSWVIEAYERNPHSGVHALCKHLIVGWKTQHELSEIDERLMRIGIRDDFGWYVSPSGMHMAIIRSPHEFWMGQVGRQAFDGTYEKGAIRSIERTFAIAMEAVTVEQFRAYPNAPASIKNLSNSEPVQGLTWKECSDFCNWLSQQDQVESSDIATIQFNGNDVIVNIEASGYRIPTLYEWEYFARAGTMTDYSFGTLETARMTLFGRDDFPFLISRLGHCFTSKAQEWTSTMVNPSCEDITSFRLDKNALFQKGGTRSTGYRSELSRIVPAMPMAGPLKCTFRIARTLPKK